MTAPLWQWDELIAAADGKAGCAPGRPITGFSIDTRSLQPGEVFVALKDIRDGHEFVGNAFKAGAAAAIVAMGYSRKPGDGPLIRVDDPLQALERIGRAARARLSPQARVIAVTGSAGKTTTKEMLRACFTAIAPGRVHAADKSFNNHWGVPLTLARMPAETLYAVFEIGMNHAGEITPLTKMVRPHVAIVTNVLPVHLEHFGTVEAIADAKAEIFAGLEAFTERGRAQASGEGASATGGNAAILNRDNTHFARLADAAKLRGAKVLSFGRDAPADIHAETVDLRADGSGVAAIVRGHRFTYDLAAAGAHIVQNSLAVAAALDAIGCDRRDALPALSGLAAPQGRGQRTALHVSGGTALLIDESYNANPASMRAALEAMAGIARASAPRRIAVIGDMLELGAQAAELHRGLKSAIDAAGVDLVLGCGPNARLLLDDIPPEKRGAWAPTSDGIRDALLAEVRAGDVVMIKGSNGSRMAPLVAALKERYGQARD